MLLNNKKPLLNNNLNYCIILYRVQFIDDSMAMEIVESENIVNKVSSNILILIYLTILLNVQFLKVNDLRKSKHEYEPMEWTPESIMYCDEINLCLVIDTNIFLSDLKLIAMIIDTFIPGIYPSNNKVLLYLFIFNFFRLWLSNFSVTMASFTRT